MKLSRSIAKTFKPELETLEGRDLLSSASIGQLLPTLVQPIQQEVSQLNAQVQTMNRDYQTILSTVATSPGPGLAVATLQNTIIQEYSDLHNDLVSIETLYNTIQASVSAGLTFEFYLIYSGNINLNNQQDLTGAVSAFETLTSTSVQASQDLNEALGIAADNPGNQYPSLNTYIDLMSH